MSRLELLEDFRVWDCPRMGKVQRVLWVEQGGPARYAVQRPGEPAEIIAAAIEIDLRTRLILINPPPGL